MSSHPDLLALARNALEARGWTIEVLAEATDDDEAVYLGVGDVLVSVVAADDYSWPVMIGVMGDEPRHLFAQSMLPFEAEEGDEVPVMELLLRLGEGELNGAFDLDFEDGSITFRTAVPVHALLGVDPDVLSAWIGDVVENNVTTVVEFLPAFEAVLHEGMAPGLAVARLDVGLFDDDD